MREFSPKLHRMFVGADVDASDLDWAPLDSQTERRAKAPKTRLERLIEIVEQEQDVVRTGGDAAQLKRHQDRLLAHITRTGKTAPFNLFTVPEATKCQK